MNACPSNPRILSYSPVLFGLAQPIESGRGLPRSKTRREFLVVCCGATFWSAPACWRYSRNRIPRAGRRPCFKL